MKRNLWAILLAALMVLSSLSTGAIGIVSVETAYETVGEVSGDAEAEVYAPATANTEPKSTYAMKPGLNIYTGTASAETFSREGADYSDIANYFGVYNQTDATFSVADGALNVSVVYGTSGGLNGYATFFNKVDKAINRPAYAYFDYNDADDVIGINYLLNTSSTQNNPISTSASSGTVKSGSGISPTITWSNTTQAGRDKWVMTLNLSLKKTGSFTLDNYTLVPYYQVTYAVSYPNGSTGDNIVKYFLSDSVNVVDGAITGLPTSYTPDKELIYPGYKFLGWSTTQGATVAEASVTLNNSDFTLYPVWEKTESGIDEMVSEFIAVPGQNMFTGDNNAYTFDKNIITDALWSNLSTHTVAVENGKMLVTTADSTHIQLGVKVAESIKRPAFVSFEHRMASGTGAGMWLPYIWQVNGTNSNGQTTLTLTTPTSFVQTYSINMGNHNGNTYYAYRNQSGADKRAMVIQWNTNGSGVLELDNYVFVPYYKATYVVKYPDGSTGTNVEKFFLSDNISVSNGVINGIPTTYTPNETLSFEGYEFKGWSTTENATEADETIALDNEDIVLYPVWAVPVITEFTWEPGANMFTGTDSAYTFDSDIITNALWCNLSTHTVSVSNSKLLVTTANSDNIQLGVKVASAVKRPAYIYYDYKLVSGSTGNMYLPYLSNPNGTGSNTTTSLQNATLNIGLSTTGRAVSVNLGNYGGNTYYAYRNQTNYNERTMVVQWYINGGGQLELDNYAFVPYYKATYVVKYPDGSTGTNVEKFFLSDNISVSNGKISGIPTSYTPDETLTFAGYEFKGWSTTDGGEAAARVALANEDITLYPVWGLNAPSLINAASIRTETHDIYGQGIRFAAFVDQERRASAVEYGFIVTRKALLGSYDISELAFNGNNTSTTGTTANGVPYVSGAAYIKDSGIDKIYSTDGDAFEELSLGEGYYFTVVVHNIPEAQASYSEKLVARPYLKTSTGIAYGEAVERSIYEVALAIRKAGYPGIVLDVDIEVIDRIIAVAEGTVTAE